MSPLYVIHAALNIVIVTQIILINNISFKH